MTARLHSVGIVCSDHIGSIRPCNCSSMAGPSTFMSPAGMLSEPPAFMLFNRLLVESAFRALEVVLERESCGCLKS